MSFSNSISSLSAQEFDALKGEIRAVMDAVVVRIHYAEERRANFSVIASALVGGGLALLTLALGTLEIVALRLAIATASTMAIGIGTGMLVMFSRQTNRYPWTAATKTWKWFYRDALPDEKRFDFGWRAYLVFGSDRNRIRHEYASQLDPFKTNILRLRDQQLSFEQDVEQLYVLHINEKYKNLHLRHLRGFLTAGLIVAAPLVVMAGMWGWRVDATKTAPHVLAQERSVLAITGAWRKLQVVEEGKSVDLLVQGQLENKATFPVNAPKWTARDRRGAPLPLESISQDPGVVPGGRSVEYSAVLRTSAAAAEEVRGLSMVEP